MYNKLMKTLTAKQFAWCYLFLYGHVDAEWSFYGGHYNMDSKKTFEALKAIKRDGIDWDKTEEPRSTTESTFEGTFDNNSYTEVMEGTIVTLEGTEIDFSCESDLSEVWSLMADLQGKTIESILNERSRKLGLEYL